MDKIKFDYGNWHKAIDNKDKEKIKKYLNELFATYKFRR